MSPQTVALVLAVLVIALLAWSPRILVALVRGNQADEHLLVEQASAIHLEPADVTAALAPEAIGAAAHYLAGEGFADAGWFTVPELPGLVLRLLVHEAEGWLGVLYEHQHLGRQWVEINARFADGTRLTGNNAPPSGLAVLPGVEVVRVEGGSVSEVLDALRRTRGGDGPAALPVDAASAPKVFEDGYATFVTMRREQGVSGDEVVRIAARPPAGGGRRAA